MALKITASSTEPVLADKFEVSSTAYSGLSDSQKESLSKEISWETEYHKRKVQEADFAIQNAVRVASLNQLMANKSVVDKEIYRGTLTTGPITYRNVAVTPADNPSGVALNQIGKNTTADTGNTRVEEREAIQRLLSYEAYVNGVKSVKLEKQKNESTTIIYKNEAIQEALKR